VGLLLDGKQALEPATNSNNKTGGSDMPHFRSLITTTVFALVLFCFSSVSAQTSDRAQVDQEIQSMYDQIKEKEKLFLAPSKEDLEIYAKFLEQPDAGLIRLLPREKYDGKLSIRGGGAYYSFTRLTHEYGYGSDIELEHGKFGVGFAGMDFGFFIPLGDLLLEDVTLESAGVKALIEYQTPPTEAEIREQYRQGHQGIKFGEFTANSRVDANAGVTYALRSFSYGSDGSDVLVAFRVIRQDQDGSVVLLWKMLKKFPPPTAIRDNRS
jgi:hypothetical protein